MKGMLKSLPERTATSTPELSTYTASHSPWAVLPSLWFSRLAYTGKQLGTVSALAEKKGGLATATGSTATTMFP
jgi:hypothetical protein